MLLIRRIVEAYVGEYASGKSENAINRALALADQGEAVTLVDLDTVEPFYTLRPIKQELSAKGITVVAWETSETMGLGEAGSVIKGEMRWVLKREGNIILDIGYGIEGSKTLNLVEGAWEDKNLQIYAVINCSRPMTSTVEEIVEHVREINPIHGLINNTHLGDETDIEVVQEGAMKVAEAARIIGIPVIATSVDAKFKGQFPKDLDCMGHQIRYLQRLMPKAFW